MPNYLKSFIYKLQCLDKDVGEIYIGSSTNFSSRKRAHKCSCNKVDGKKYNNPVYQFIRENGGWENWEMVKILEFPCDTKKELISEEARYIKDIGLDNCLNYCIPGRTQKEWEQDNNEYRKVWKKKYDKKNRDRRRKYEDDNRDKIKSRTTVKITCICGSVIQRVEKARHERSQKHKKFLEENPESE